EDGIRDRNVTGVQTCALPIYLTGWTIPKFDQLLGSSSGDDDWCEPHGVPESICVECDEKLLPRIKPSWCAIHGVHYCPFERPERSEERRVGKEGRGRVWASV